MNKKQIWIDLENTPHVPFFIPIIKELKGRGYDIIITARNCFQVCELASLHALPCEAIGRHYGKNKILKCIGLLIRAAQLTPFIIKSKPDLAIGHGSRSQLLLASILGVPTLEILDYEYSINLPLFHPTWAMAPIVIPNNKINAKKGVLRYHGIKEDVYASRLKPDQNILDEFGINGKDIVVIIRPPATEAHYHNSRSEELYCSAIDFIGSQRNTRIIIIPRGDRQAEFVRENWCEWYREGKIIIPNKVVDGLNLIWNSDLVISGGGTMNREAAALGVPVYSIFRGKIGAVDEYLVKSGRLTLISTKDEIQEQIKLIRRNRHEEFNQKDASVLNAITNAITEIMQ